LRRDDYLTLVSEYSR